MADWFRSPEWSEEAQVDFDVRLKRARASSRAQYLRIKGVHLQAAGNVEGARAVWLRCLENDGQYAEMQHTAALEHLADSYAGEDPDKAESYYRRLLLQPGLPSGTSGAYQISLAEVLLDRGTAGDLEEAGALLAEWKQKSSMPFWSVHFRWELALVRLAEGTGEREVARAAARRALDLAARGPVFPRHKRVGVVDADRKTLARLERLAR